jgi:2-phospho-L-lactate guanylyltransferase
MIIVPVKNLANAKQRLSAALDPQARLDLAHAMCTDVLETLVSWTRRPTVMIVTSDPFASDLGERFGFEIAADEMNPGETGAIEMATALCRERGVDYTLVIPADIPLIETSELDQILTHAPPSGAVLVPDSAGRGTNAALRAPCDLFPLRFGNDSFLPHREAARATGFPCIVLELPGIALDVDRPEDLYMLAAASGERKSQRLVRSWSLEAQVCRG